VLCKGFRSVDTNEFRVNRNQTRNATDMNMELAIPRNLSAAMTARITERLMATGSKTTGFAERTKTNRQDRQTRRKLKTDAMSKPPTSPPMA
jgi:hypothetical protein